VADFRVEQNYNRRDAMKENDQTAKTLSTIIRARRSIRSFTNAVPLPEEMNEILQSAAFAPFGGATGISLKEIRKIFVFSQGTEKMHRARELLLTQMRRGARKIRIALLLFPFLKKRMQPFANRISALAKTGIPGLTEGAYYIVVAEKKGFPPIEKQSLAHVMQNMWLSATAQGLGFELITATGMMSKNKEFMQLLGLEAGDYAIDGCVIGVPKTAPEPREERQMEDFVTWIK
jgi:nitroreductase